jgi:hypothetical protein
MAAIVGESPALTQKAVDVAIPALAGAACNRASTPNGATELLSMLSSSDSGVVSNFASQLTGGAATQNLMHAGANLLSGLLRGNTNSVASVVAAASGISAPGASSVLSLIAPLVFALLRPRGYLA